MKHVRLWLSILNFFLVVTILVVSVGDLNTIKNESPMVALLKPPSGNATATVVYYSPSSPLLTSALDLQVYQGIIISDGVAQWVVRSGDGMGITQPSFTKGRA
jgi:hypothetical protein